MSSMNSNALPNDSTSTSTDSTKMISKIISPSLATATTSDDSLTGLSASELTDLSCVAQSVPLMLYTYTVNHDSGECNFPFVSDYCEEIFGLPASKVVEDSEAFVNLIHPDDVKEFAASVLESMINLTPWDHKMRMKDIDSRIVYIHGKSSPRRRDIINQDGSNTKCTIWYGALSDITNNYNEEESKISDSDGDSDGKYENTSTKERCLDPCPSQSSYLPCFELDKDGTITLWNKHMTELTIGLLEQDVKGENVKSIVPDTHQGKNEVINLISAINHIFIPLSGTPEQGNHNHNCFNDQVHELTVLSKTGTEINLRISCKRSQNNNTLACTCTDVTVLKQAEKEKIDALRLLDAEKNLTEWLSHEIRNPLSIAMEAAQSLREEFESNYFPTSQTTKKLDQIYETNNMDNHSYVNLIIKSISYVVDLLSKMLDLNKVAEGKILLRPSICSLREDIIRPVQQMMQLKGNKVHISITGEDMNIYIDKLRLKQVITNLVSNAIKFTKEGFVIVHSYRTNKDVDGSDIPDSLVISVSDSGVGVLQKNLMQLFSKWERLGSNVNGTGIGLCLSRFLVLAMKGQIYLNESYDSGVKGSPGAQVRLIYVSIFVSTQYITLYPGS
jgi:signal transduction histidine kinase